MIDKEQVVEKNCILDMIDKEQVVEKNCYSNMIYKEWVVEKELHPWHKTDEKQMLGKELHHWHDRQGTSDWKITAALKW